MVFHGLVLLFKLTVNHTNKENTVSDGMKLCIDCKHCETRTGHGIQYGNLIEIERFDYCSLLQEIDELNTETKQLCDKWEPRKNGGI